MFVSCLSVVKCGKKEEERKIESWKVIHGIGWDGRAVDRVYMDYLVRLWKITFEIDQKMD